MEKNSMNTSEDLISGNRSQAQPISRRRSDSSVTDKSVQPLDRSKMRKSAPVISDTSSSESESESESSSSDSEVDSPPVAKRSSGGVSTRSSSGSSVKEPFNLYKRRESARVSRVPYEDQLVEADDNTKAVWKHAKETEAAELAYLVGLLIEESYQNVPTSLSKLAKVAQKKKYVSVLNSAVEPLMPVLINFLAREVIDETRICDNNVVEIFYHLDDNTPKKANEINWLELPKFIQICNLDKIFDISMNFNKYVTKALSEFLNVPAEQMNKISASFGNITSKERYIEQVLFMEDFLHAYSGIFADMVMVHVRMVNAMGSNSLPIYSNDTNRKLPVFDTKNIIQHNPLITENLINETASDVLMQTAFMRVFMEKCVKVCCKSNYSKVQKAIMILAQTLLHSNCESSLRFWGIDKNLESTHKPATVMSAFKTLSKVIHDSLQCLMKMDSVEFYGTMVEAYFDVYEEYTHLMNVSPSLNYNMLYNQHMTENEISDYKKNNNSNNILSTTGVVALLAFVSIPSIQLLINYNMPLAKEQLVEQHAQTVATTVATPPVMVEPTPVELAQIQDGYITHVMDNLQNSFQDLMNAVGTSATNCTAILQNEASIYQLFT